MTLHGIDVSSYQTGIDLTRVPGDVVIVKATEGRGYRNPAMAAQVASAMAAGKRLGLYHFVSAGNTPAEEANNFLGTVVQLDDFVPVLDFEPADRSRVTWAAEWLNLVEAALGVRPWIYMDSSTAGRDDWGAVRASTPLWVARYPSSQRVDGYSPPGDYRVAGWQTVGWQYTENGFLPGWSDRLDLNAFYLDRDQWAAHAARRGLGSGPLPPVVEVPTPEPPVHTEPGDAPIRWVYGYRACGCIRDSLPGIEAALVRGGFIRKDLSGLVTQGCYSGGAVSASAGTHDGGGVWDLSNSLASGGQSVASMDRDQKLDHAEFLAIFRRHGAIAWHRTPAQSASFPFHYHVVWAGCPHLSDGAAAQVADYRRGLNGLAGRGPDDGPSVPYITWQDAIKAAGTAPQPLPKGDEMILISSPGRKPALIAGGMFRELVTAEEVEQAAGIADRKVVGNDRQYDLWRSMTEPAAKSSGGASQASVDALTKQVGALAEQVSQQRSDQAALGVAIAQAVAGAQSVTITPRAV